MNPLIQNNVDGVGLRFNHWENLVKEKIDEVRKLERVGSAANVQASPVQPTVAVAIPASAGADSSGSGGEDSTKILVISSQSF